MYHKALAMEPQKVDGESVDDFNLQQEIAYNLSLIYRKSGNHEQANFMLMNYC